MSELTPQEKIDYIYKVLRKEQRKKTIGFILKWGIRLFVVLFFVYFYYFGFELIAKKVSEKIKTNFKNGAEVILEKKDDVVDYLKEKGSKLYNGKKGTSEESGKAENFDY